MSLLYFLADAFINTFGITQPTEKTRRQAALFIGALLLILVATVTVVGFLLHGILG